jgi:hypothetical protein
MGRRVAKRIRRLMTPRGEVTTAKKRRMAV